MATKQHQSDSPRKRTTSAQRRARVEMCTLSAAWNNLTEEERQAWEAEARSNRRGGLGARLRRRSGRRLFMKVNFKRLALRQDLLPTPPGVDSLRPITLARLVITCNAGRIALKLRMSGADVEGIMVSASRPCNPGVMAWNKFTRIGLLPALKDGVSDITRPYVAKFGVPPVGKKVFIRIQQMNDYLGSVVQTMSAIVGASPDGAPKPKGQQTQAKT